MYATRIGKIARLPKAVQDELNRRLENHELGEPLLAWLNDRPDVRQVLAAQFDGHPINKQNLSQWRRGGFREWQTRQDALKELPGIMAGLADELPSDGPPLSEKLAPWMTARFFVTAKAELDACADADKFKLMRTMCGELSALRLDDHRLARRNLDEERLALEIRSVEKGTIVQRLGDLARELRMSRAVPHESVVPCGEAPNREGQSQSKPVKASQTENLLFSEKTEKACPAGLPRAGWASTQRIRDK
jgi:hypothetical protein